MIIKEWISNIITASRFVLALFFVLNLRVYKWNEGCNEGLIVLIIIFSTICLTDIIDGKIARKLGVVSSMGAVMDVSADLFYIVSATIVLNYLKIVPIWFTIVIIIKFCEFIITSHVMKKSGNNIKATFVFDYFGSFSAILFYIMPGIVIMLHGIFRNTWLMSFALYVTALIALISIVARCWNCAKITAYKGYQSKSILWGKSNG